MPTPRKMTETPPPAETTDAEQHAADVAERAQDTAPGENATRAGAKTGQLGEVWTIEARKGQRVTVTSPRGDTLRARGRADGTGAHVALVLPGDWTAQALTDAGNPSGGEHSITVKD